MINLPPHNDDDDGGGGGDRCFFRNAEIFGNFHNTLASLAVQEFKGGWRELFCEINRSLHTRMCVCLWA